MKFKRLWAAALAVCFLVSVFCACGNSRKLSEEVLVKEDDIWYDSIRFKVELTDDEHSNQEAECLDVIYKDGKLYAPFIVDRTEDGEDIVDTYLNIYDMDGSCVSRIIKYPEDPDIWMSTLSIVPNKDGQTATAFVWRSRSGSIDYTYYFSTIDLATGEAGEFRKIKEVSEDGVFLGYRKILVVGDYICLKCGDGAGNDILMFYEGDRFVSRIDVKDLSGGEMLYDMETIYPQEETDLVYVSYFSETGKTHMLIDPATGNVLDNQKQSMEEIRNSSFSMDNADMSALNRTAEGELMCCDHVGNIYSFNGEDDSLQLVIDNNQYSPYFYDYSEARNFDDISVLSHTDDQAVLSFLDLGFQSGYENPVYNITILNKTEKNPNVGKKVIDLTFRDDCSDYMSSAIYNFNKTNEEYLIRLWEDKDDLLIIPNGRNYTSFDTDSSENMIHALNKDKESIYSYEQKLIEDLKGTDVPDLILDLQNTRAYNDDCLEDISDYLAPEVRAMLFENVIEATKYEGKNYFLPVTISINGIICPEDAVSEGNSGFTFEEYSDFVKGPSNGIEPFAEYYNSRERTKFLLACVDINSISSNDKIDFGTEQFIKAAEYAKNEYITTYTGEEISYLDYCNLPAPCAKYTCIDTYNDFIAAYTKVSKPYRIMGAPSVDATGPSFDVEESISVSSASEVKDGVKIFIDYLFKGEFKDGEVFTSIPINKDVLAYDLPILNQICMRNYSLLIDHYEPPEVISDLGFRVTTDLMIEQFIKSLSDLSYYSHTDPELTLILIEEMDSYFNGDKPLDEVISVINDKAQKIMDERK